MPDRRVKVRVTQNQNSIGGAASALTELSPNYVMVGTLPNLAPVLTVQYASLGTVLDNHSPKPDTSTISVGYALLPSLWERIEF